MLVQFFALSVPYLWHFLQCLRSFMNVCRKLSEIIYMNFYARSIVPMHVLHVIFCIFEYFHARFRMFIVVVFLVPSGSLWVLGLIFSSFSFWAKTVWKQLCGHCEDLELSKKIGRWVFLWEITFHFFRDCDLTCQFTYREPHQNLFVGGHVQYPAANHFASSAFLPIGKQCKIYWSFSLYLKDSGVVCNE